MSALTYLLGNGPTASPLGLRISLFFGALFLAYGVVVPYFPVWLDARGLDPLQISTVTALPLFVRLLVTPSIGLLADRLGNYRLVIVTLAWCAMALIGGLSLVSGYAPILLIGVAFLLANGTMLPLIETIAVGGVRTQGLDYGRMRLWGSITFIIANFVGGIAIEALGGSFALWLIAFAGVATIAAAHALPPPPVTVRAAAPIQRANWRTSSPARLLGSRLFILFLVAIGCTHGAHATFYTFGALHWQAQGLSAAWVGTLWAIGVFAEVVLFALSAPVVRRFGPAQLIVAGAGASVVRWGVMAFDPPLGVLIPLQAAARAHLRRCASRRHPVHHARRAAPGHGQRAGFLRHHRGRPGAGHRRAHLGGAVRADRRRGLSRADRGRDDRLLRRRHAVARLGRAGAVVG